MTSADDIESDQPGEELDGDGAPKKQVGGHPLPAVDENTQARIGYQRCQANDRQFEYISLTQSGVAPTVIGKQDEVGP